MRVFVYEYSNEPEIYEYEEFIKRYNIGADVPIVCAALDGKAFNVEFLEEHINIIIK